MPRCINAEGFDTNGGGGGYGGPVDATTKAPQAAKAGATGFSLQTLADPTALF